MLFAEYDRSSPIKNFTDRLNLCELQVDDISAKFTAENTTKLYTTQVNRVLNRCFLVFSVRIGRGYQKFFDCQLHMSSAVFCAITRYCFINKVESWYPP